MLISLFNLYSSESTLYSRIVEGKMEVCHKAIGGTSREMYGKCTAVPLVSPEQDLGRNVPLRSPAMSPGLDLKCPSFSHRDIVVLNLACNVMEKAITN